MNLCLQIKNLRKTYDQTVALEGFNYTFTPGVYGILGANGAGKSTLFKLLTDSIRCDSGSIFWNGQNICAMGRNYRKLLGYMPQAQGYYGSMSGRDFLLYMGRLKGLSQQELKRQIPQLLSVVGLETTAEKKMGKYSGGMLQRVLLAQALLGDPQLLILDEPTAGVDPQERIRIRSYISTIAQDRIVLLATHIVSDVECIANQVLLLNKGVLVNDGTPEELIASVEGKVAERNCTQEEVRNYQATYGLGILSQNKEGQLLRLVSDVFPPGFRKAQGRIGLEEVYLYYCVSNNVL